MASKKQKEETKKKTTTTEKKETTKKTTAKATTTKKTTTKETTMDKQIKAAFKESLPKNFVETRNLTFYGSKDGKPVSQPIMARKELPVVQTKSGDLRIDADQKTINKVIDTNYQAAQTKKKQGNSTKKTTSSSTKKSNTANSKKTTKKTAEPARSLTTSRLPTTENAIKKTNLTNSLINYRQGPIRANRVDLQDSQQRMKFVEPALKLPSRPYDFVEHSRKTIEKKFQDTYSRNNIVPDSFSINDFYKWANEHNFEPRMNGSMQVYYTPKYEGKVLGFGGKKLTTEQDERDFEVLKALAENNERRKINAGKNKAYDRFLSTMDVLTLGGSTMIHDARAKNEYQKSGLNPKNFIGYEDIIKKPINTEKIGTTAMNAVNAGSSSAAKSFAAGLDFIMPTDFLGDYDWFSYVNRRFGEDQNAYSAAMMQSAKGNKALEIGGQVLMGVTAALPHTLLAMMSGGLSAIGGVAQQAGNGTAAAIKAVTTSMAKNPLYWSSFLSNVGIEYEDAINNGADEKTASISAVLVAMINSGIEIGSGIEMLPKEIMKGNGRNLWKLVKSSIEEGGEEVFQGMISRGMAKIMYDSEREVFSIKTEDAVINPLTSAKEFGMGTAVGAFLGGGPALGSMIIDAGRNVTAKNLKKDGSRMGIVRELYRNGFNETNNNADIATAEAIIRMANNTASEADIELVGRSDAAKNIVQILANDKKAAQAVKDANAVNKKERTLQQSNQKNTEGNVIKNETVKDLTPKAEIPKSNVSDKSAVSIAKEMGDRIGKKVIIVPEKITSFLDGENGRQPIAEQNKTLFVDEKRLNEEYDAFYELGKKGVPFEEIPDDIETVILDEHAARAAYEMGQEAEIKEKPKSIKKESTVIKAAEKQKGMIVQNKEAEQMKRMQPKAYSNIEHMANNLGVNVTFVSELTNSKGQKLDGEITKDGIKLNVNADDPIRYVTTHEFGHRMKQLDEKGWKTYQDYVVKYWQKQGDYDVKMQALSEAYGEEMSIEELHEELACDFGEEMFKSEAVLTDFIKKDRTLAEKIKDVWFKVLSAFSDKARLRHAQNLWAKCYNNAVEKAENGENSFVGEKFSYAGVSAETADITALSDAQNMERDGKNAEEIWQKTGWSRGLDRKWRFEIDDLESSLIEKPAVRLHHDSNSDYYTGKLEDILNHPKLFKAYPSLKNVDVIIQETNPGISGTAFTKSNQIVLSETLFRKLSSEYEDLINNRQKYIDEIEATPEYKKYNAIYKMKDEELSAEEWLKLEKAARDKFFSSELGKRYYKLVWGKDETVKKYEIGWSDKAKEVLIHEIQHLIQYKEGFASGASVNYWQKQLDKGFDSRTKEEKKTLAKLQNEFYELIKTDPEFFREMEKLTSMKPDVPRGAINWETLEKIEEDPIEWKNYDKKLNELEEKFGAEKVSKFILLNSRIEEQKKKGRTAGDLYYNTAGEREARNAAERINMSADERRKQFPKSFKSDDYIVFAEEGNVSFSYGVNQQEIDSYVDKAYENKNENDYIKYAKPSLRLKQELNQNVELEGYSHALRDNDIRHIRNSHGEKTNEKYPIKKEDIKKIPYIVENYDKVFYKTNSKGEGGIVYVKVASEDVVYYVEAITTQYHNEKLLINKQMIKTGIDNVPNLHGLLSAINKKQSTAQYLADLKKIRKAYVQDVKEPYSADNSLSKNEKSVKQKQLEIIEKYNPAPNSYSAWVRSESDIKTLEEALMDEENEGYDEFVPDYTRNMVENAIKTGKITVYSSYPIEQGTFVSASKMEAESYSGNGKVYEKEVSINDVAWLDVTQGQYAKVEGKAKISGIKEVEEKISARKLEEENKRLREQIENMHIQLNQAEGKGLDLKSIKAAARRIKETYHSTIPLSTIHQELSRIYTAMSSSEADGSEINKKIVELSNKVIDNALVKNDERSLMYGELLDRIKNTKIAVPESEKQDFADGFENYRKSVFGKLRLSNDGVEIDMLWDELTTEYPLLFSENILGTEERLNKILRIRQDLQPIYENYYGEEGNIAIAKTALANDIMESFFSIPENDGGTKYVFYDKRAAQAETALKKAEERYKETLNKLERKYGKEIEKAKKDRDSAKERYSEKELKRSIDRDFNYLNTMLTKPTDSRHVPEEMRGSVAYLLSLFDFETKRSDALRDEGTDKPSVKAVKLAEMADAYEKIMRETFGVTGVQNENNIMFDKVLAEDIAELKAEIDSSEIGKFKRIEDMSLSELQTAQKIIRGIHHMVTNKNKAFSNGIKENIHDLGIAVIKESADERKSKSSKRNIEGDRKEWGEGKPQTIRTLLNTLDNLVNYDNLAAYDFFHRIGGTMETLYRELRKGFDKHAWNIKEAEEKISDIIGKTKVDKWTGNKAKAQEFTTASGKIRLTPAQVMSLYALSKRKSAQDHLYLGGIQVGHNVAKTGKLKKENIGSAKTYKVTSEDLARMFETLSDEQKRIVDGIVKFMTETCSEWGNETSMKLYGYKKFGESYYFPMDVAKSSLPQSFESRGSKKIQNAGNTKKLKKGAKNPLVINDFFDVVTEHISTMSLYNTQVLPLLDMERVLNYSRWELAQDEEGLHSEYGSSVREEFVRTWGEKADQYIKKLIGDINGDKRTEKSPLDSMLNTAKKVSVAANTRVFLQQFTAVNRALNYINPIDFVGVFKKDNSKKMLKYSAIAYWKNLGFYDINVGKSMKQILFEKTPAIDTVTLEPYGWADKVSWSAIWGACEQEIKRKTDLEVGSEEFYEKVAEKFDYVIDRSQVVDSVFHRTQSMRSTNDFAKVSTAFMSEPLKELNMIRTDVLDAVRNGKKIKTLPRLLTIYTTSAALQALAQLVPDMARKAPEKWYDEDDEKIDTKEMWLKEILQNFTDSLNPITKMPYISDIYEIYKGYTQERFELAQITDIINSLKPKTLYDTKKAPWQRVWNVISAIAMAKGVPTNGIMREFKSYGSSLFRIKDGTEYGDYIITKYDYNVKNPDNKSKFMKFYNAAVKAGHSEAAIMIMDDYIASNLKEYKKNKDAVKAAKKLIKTSEKADEKTLMYELPSKNVTIGETKHKLEGEEYFKYASSVSDKLWQLALEVTSEKEFKTLDTKYQYEALEKARSYAYALAKKESFPEYELPEWMKKIQEGDTTIIEELQDSIAADEKAKIGSKLYKAAQKSDEAYDKLLKEYEDKFGVDYMVGAITEEMKNTDEYKKDPEKYKKEVADDYLIGALLEVATETPEYKEDLAKYNKEIVIDQSKLSKTAVSKAKELRKEAAKYYATKENFSRYEGEGNFKKYDDMLNGKMDINEYISFMAQIYDYKKALNKSSLKKVETASFINRYDYPIEVKRNLFKIVMPNVKNIPY